MQKVPDKMWIGFDWKSAEMFMLCAESRDNVLREVLTTKDIHSYVYGICFGENPNERKTFDEREISKIISFSLGYSGFDTRVALFNTVKSYRKKLHQDVRLGLSTLTNEEIEAKISAIQETLAEGIHGYTTEFSGLTQWIDDTLLKWHDSQGYVSYFLGAKKHIPVAAYLKRDPDKLRQNTNGRVAINTFGQNGIGLLLKTVLSKMYNDEFVRNHTCQIIPVFDALYMLVDTTEAMEVMKRVNHFATPILNHDGFKIQMQAEWVSSIKSWGECKPLQVEVPPTEQDTIEYKW